MLLDQPFYQSDPFLPCNFVVRGEHENRIIFRLLRVESNRLPSQHHLSDTLGVVEVGGDFFVEKVTFIPFIVVYHLRPLQDAVVVYFLIYSILFPVLELPRSLPHDLVLQELVLLRSLGFPLFDRLVKQDFEEELRLRFSPVRAVHFLLHSVNTSNVDNGDGEQWLRFLTN